VTFEVPTIVIVKPAMFSPHPGTEQKIGLYVKGKYCSYWIFLNELQKSF